METAVPQATSPVNFQPSATAAPTATADAKPTATATPTATPIPTQKPDTLSFYEPAEYQDYAPTTKTEGNNNPILINSFACDPYAMEYNGRLYVYMTNDSQQYETGNRQEDNKYGYINSLHIISTDDMVNWTDHGTYQISGKNGGVCTWANCCWAPCAVTKKVNGKDKFYVYFTNGGYQIGVVEADSPTGPFKDIKGGALVGPNKIGDKYYYSYCSDWNTRTAAYSNLGACSIGYMVADNIMGPYKFVGDLLPNCGTVFGVYGNNHHSMISYKGQYYIFYHTRVLEGDIGCTLGYRSVQVNKVTFDENGVPEQVIQDRIGVEQIANFNPYQQVSGTTSSNCGGMVAIHNNENGAYMEPIYLPLKYKYSWTSISNADFGEETSCTFKTSLTGPANGSATIKVCLDALDSEAILTLPVKYDSTGKALVSAPIDKIEGTHTIYFEIEGKTTSFDQWEFAK